MDMYNGCLCEVQKPSNEMIAIGYVTDFTEDYVELESRRFPFPNMSTSFEVKIIITNDNTYNVYMGEIFWATNKKLKIAKLRCLTTNNQREFFRYSVKEKVKVEKIIEEYAEEASESSNVTEALLTALNKEPNIPDPVIMSGIGMLKDLSLSGASLETELQFEQEDVINIFFPYKNQFITYNCEVRRKIPLERKKIRYGCLFVNNTNHQTSILYQYILKMQQKQLSILRDSM